VLVGFSELARRTGALPFGADRSVLIAGPLALSTARAEEWLGWKPVRTSDQVLGEALSAPR
ncbi:MAG: hypothetical protein ACRDYC_12345, partial [Acidimicrobiales bacterium]